MIGIDISRSMQASDAAPSRVEAARRVALALIEGLGEQRVGVFLFAGQPYVLVPPTEDADLARWFIEGVDRELVNENDEGTRIHAALEQSAGILTANRRETGSRSVVLISDGETSEDVRQLVQVARDLASRGIIVHTIGVGTEGGAGVSVPDRPGRWGGPIIDPDGRPAITRLNEPLLREVADAGGGIYLRAGTAASVDVTSVSPLIRVVASGRVGGLAGLDPATGLAVIALGLLVAHPLGSVLRHRSASRLRGKGARG
jgi:Ca-activated chloride channel family protein